MIDFDKKAISKVIRNLRVERKLSQEVASGFAGIARSHLAMIESGKKLPNFETLWAIAYAYNISPHELVLLIEKESQRKKENERD